MTSTYAAPVLDWYAGQRPGPAVAAAGRLALVGPGQRDHASADAGEPGAARPRGLAGPVADARRAGGGTPADAVRQWDRLGYPRRAVRLHAIAQRLISEHGGQVPASAEELRTLPGVGAYTAAAVASFAFGQRHAVLDTNVRRVLARLVTGDALPRRRDLGGRAPAGRVAAASRRTASPPAGRWR